MTSRLDRLFLLLETGSSPLTRKAAAVQLGEVQRLHPHELRNLLVKLRRYLYSLNWDTRIAAGQAVEAIISNVPEWMPQGIKKENDSTESGNLSLVGRMKFSDFDMNKVIECGSKLLACESSKSEMDEHNDLDPQERLAKQQEMLNKHLGLSFSSIFFCKEDFDVYSLPTQAKVKEENNILKSDLFNVGTSQTSNFKSSASNSYDEPVVKKRRIKENLSENSSFDSDGDNYDPLDENKQWPLEAFSDMLVHDLLNASWEVRHGAATALREIVRIHGKEAGKKIDASADQMEALNQLWLEDLCLRLVCVLALDKFGDFISDQVVAPVRETCAQVLGIVANILIKERVSKVLELLLQLLSRSEWEARHGGLLGLKYILSVRKDMQNYMIPLVFESVCKCLKDQVDDVSAVAASALVPVTTIIISTLPDKIASVISSLWDAVLDLDDLTVSTSSILQLLASLLSSAPSVIMPNDLEELVPRLWPFLSHNSYVVRKSVLQALLTLTSMTDQQVGAPWLHNILQPALQLIFQRCLVDHVSEIHELLFKVWQNLILQASTVFVIGAALPLLGAWTSMLMQPPNVPFQPSPQGTWLDAPHKIKFPDRNRNSGGHRPVQELHYIGGSETSNESPKDREKNVIRAKLTGAKFIGFITSHVTKDIPEISYPPGTEHPLESFVKLILFHLNYKSAQQRFVIALILDEWAKHTQGDICPSSIKEKCLECLCEVVYYDEIASAFTRLQQDCRDFIAQLNHYKIPIDASFSSSTVYTFEQIINLTSMTSSSIALSQVKPKSAYEALQDKRKLLLLSATQANDEQTSLKIMVQSSIAGALVSLKYLPEKMNPIIRPLMESIKHSENYLLQEASAHHLVSLIELCFSRTNCPNAKIIKNLTKFLCYDVVNFSLNDFQNSGHSLSMFNNTHVEIITLGEMQKSAEKILFRRSNSIAKKAMSNASSEVGSPEEEVQKINARQAQGATYVFTHAAEHFSSDLPEKLQNLWESIFLPLKKYINVEEGNEAFTGDINLYELLCSLQLLKVTCSHYHEKLYSELESVLPHISHCLDHPLPIIRNKAALCLGKLSKVIIIPTMNIVLSKVLAKLGASDNDYQRQGAVEAIACIIDNLGLDIVPYIVFLVIPMMGGMCDQNEQVRLLATHCFASLIKLMPLENSAKNAPTLLPILEDKKEKERLFLYQLMNPKEIEPFIVPVPVKAELRSYQQEGINWLAFLNKYKLNGILCDDMGLGKTLQSICILAGDHFIREQAYMENKTADCKPLPSLVVCPPTLTGHWIYEVEKFVESCYLNPIHYTGPPVERMRLRSKIKKHNLIVASYEIVRNDIDFFGSIKWNYCILDEGHIIKNGKTKLAKAIKQLSCNHRLILSGTPIQNNVLELWSLFDFLLPGFLGSERQFTARYSRPILQSRDARASSREQENGVLAMESLHRQVLPFLLRRMKEDVLKDLPPKIIQDYYCELSALQVRLYEDFTKSRAKQSVDTIIKDGEDANSLGTSHVFQALQYLRKVCNHPKLVLTPSHPEFESVSQSLKEQNSTLCDINHATKLCALRQLLQDCGIGVMSSNPDQGDPTPAVNQHRALIFCQLKSMLDILEKDLFKCLMPSVSYLRLDGSIPHGMRHSVVHTFNNDPSIDALLLTTQVGGLGLNLTGADTVIFVEHDWNPMKDLQAMDRAHRIGQKKVVNVYRLITRGTLEEKIMGLQKFKVSVANSVINQENTSLQKMGTDQLLDLFSLDNKNKGEKIYSKSETDSAASKKTTGMKCILENLPELWDTSQYESEYNLDNFLQSLK